MAKTDSLPVNYSKVLEEIKTRVRTAQYEALKVVNLELIALYWDIGRIIMHRQQEISWGKSVVERLAVDLQKEFPGVSGFSTSNLWRMRNFFKTYAADPKLAPLVREKKTFVPVEKGPDSYKTYILASNCILCLSICPVM